MKRAGWMAATVLSGLLAAGAARADGHVLMSAHVPDIVSSHQVALAGVPDPAASMFLSVSLPQRNQAALQSLLADIYNPASPNYRHFLSVAQFAEQFGPTQADYEAARSFFTENGLTVGASAANRYLFTVSGPVATVERVFHVTMGLYKHPSENRMFVAPDREPTLDLAVPVQHVTGLDNLDLPHSRLVKLGPNAKPRAPTGSGPGGNFTGSDVRTAYVGSNKLDGAGQAVGLMELGGYELSDVQAYFTSLNQPLNVNIVGISTDGAKLTCKGKCDDGEQVLDIEYAVSMAPGLSEVQVYVGHNAEDVLNQMASDNTSAQLSTSWGWGVREYSTDHPLFLEFAAQGQTSLTASGDYSSLKDSDPWPEEDAYITAVGGTDLQTVSAGGAWKSERGWNGSAGGPALSTEFPIESYQLPFVNSANGASKKRRNVPDIAGDANVNNYICADGGCGGGNGGTSFASPIWAGFIALANERAAQLGLPRVGFINPALYALGGQANYDSLFHDQVLGKSGLYSAVFSFDLVTGLGSPQVGLIGALAGEKSK